MNWEIEVVGTAVDVDEIVDLAAASHCVVARDVDGRFHLSGTRFNALADLDDVRTEAARVLAVLNGLARVYRSDHTPVQLGSVVVRRDAEGRRHIDWAVQPGAVRIRGPRARMMVTRTDGSIEYDSETTSRIEHASRIAADPRLQEIMVALAGAVSWQRLRVVFEKFNTLVGKGDNALVMHGYATQDELTRFKANVEDPRHSGLDAVHGVPDGPLKGTKMGEHEGLAFVSRLLKAYLAR